MFVCVCGGGGGGGRSESGVAGSADLCNFSANSTNPDFLKVKFETTKGWQKMNKK